MKLPTEERKMQLNVHYIKQSSKERKEYIGNILNNKQLHDETMAEIRRRKEKNIGILRSYGVDI